MRNGCSQVMLLLTARDFWENYSLLAIGSANGDEIRLQDPLPQLWTAFHAVRVIEPLRAAFEAHLITPLQLGKRRIFAREHSAHVAVSAAERKVEQRLGFAYEPRTGSVKPLT